MATNYVIPTNLVLEMIILSGHSYELGYSTTISNWQRGIDETCVGIISLCLVLNVLWIIYFRAKGREYTTKCLMARAFQGGVIIVVGVLLIVVAMSIKKSKNCMELYECERFETRIVIAVLVIADSIFYFLPPLRPNTRRVTTAVMQPPRVFPIHGEHGGNQLYFVEPPPSYFQVHNSNTMPPPPPYGSVVSNEELPRTISSIPAYPVDTDQNINSDANNNHLTRTPNQFHS